MQEKDLLKHLIDEKIINILKVFTKNPEKKFYLTELAKESGVNISSNFRILKKLLKTGIISQKIIGRTKYYQLTDKPEIQKILKSLGFNISSTIEEPLKKFIEVIKAMGRVEQIILNSKSKDGVKLILIGDFIPSERIEKITEEIKKKYKFKISFAELKTLQFKKLSNFEESFKLGKTIYKKGN